MNESAVDNLEDFSIRLFVFLKLYWFLNLDSNNYFMLFRAIFIIIFICTFGIQTSQNEVREIEFEKGIFSVKH